MSESIKNVYLFFNHCHHKQAAQNKLEMKSMLDKKAQ